MRLLLAVAVCAAIGGGCGSSGGESSESSGGEPTARATTPSAPPGASARSCGNTTVAGTEGLRVTGIGCDVGRGVVAAWDDRPTCSRPARASRFSCTVGEYRCLAATSERGIAVSCSRPGSSISFFKRRG
ncbi:MAG TPA: hypothetical protein VFG58_02010 [Solirubrobacterales bacterium]|nr:hypothetical protein [Solirubrobacterales bacterium]